MSLCCAVLAQGTLDPSSGAVTLLFEASFNVQVGGAHAHLMGRRDKNLQYRATYRRGIGTTYKWEVRGQFRRAVQHCMLGV